MSRTTTHRFPSRCQMSRHQDRLLLVVEEDPPLLTQLLEDSLSFSASTID